MKLKKCFVVLLMGLVFAVTPLNSAHAVPPAFAGAYSFLEASAAAAGLSVGDYVATIAGATAVGTGMNIGNNAGVSFGNTAAQNLDNLLDAADYPPWEELTSEQQAAWETKENYQASKFNLLAGVFGMQEDYEAYAAGFSTSGGASWDFSTQGQRQLDRLGRIGALWANNASNTVGEVMDTIKDANAVTNYFGDPNVGHLDGTDIDGYPSDMPKNIDYALATRIRGFSGTNVVFSAVSSVPVYMICGIPNGQGTVLMASESTFKWGSNPDDSSTNTPWNYDYTFTYRGKTVYLAKTGNSYIQSFDMPMLSNSDAYTLFKTGWSNSCFLVAWHVVYGGGELNELVPIADYPETLDTTQAVYFPVSGVTPSTTWNEYITYEGDSFDDSGIIEAIQSCCQRFHFYTTGQLKVHDEGVWEAISDLGVIVNDIKNILLTWPKMDVTDAPDIIGNVDFDELDVKTNELLDTISTLAPFGALLLLSEVYSILASSAVLQTPRLVFDFNFLPDHSYDLIIDLSWLNDGKPLINAVCIIALIIGLCLATYRLVELEAAS